jgi:Protein of unknown function (DUF2726)
MDSQQLSLAVAILGFVIVLGLIARFRASRGTRPLPYERAGRLSAPAEPSFLGSLLEQVLDNKYCILGKVCLADVIEPRRHLSYTERTAALDRVVHKQVDFAVCDVETREIVGVIELDDECSARKSRKRGDAFLLAALAAAGVPIACLRAQTAYAPEEMRRQVLGAFALARS